MMKKTTTTILLFFLLVSFASAYDVVIVAGGSTVSGNEATLKTDLENNAYVNFTVLGVSSAGGANITDYEGIADCAIIFSSCNSGVCGNNADDAVMGITWTGDAYYDEFGACAGTGGNTGQTQINISDNTDYITNGFSLGALTIHSSGQQIDYGSTCQSHWATLATHPTNAGQVYLIYGENNTAQYGSASNTTGRRVGYGFKSENYGSITDDGKEVLFKALNWSCTPDAQVSTPPPANNPPTIDNFSPANNSEVTNGLSLNISARYNDADADAGTFYFMNASNNAILCTNSTTDGSTYYCNVPMNYNDNLLWYVNATDGTNYTVSGTYNVTLREETPPADPQAEKSILLITSNAGSYEGVETTAYNLLLSNQWQNFTIYAIIDDDSTNFTDYNSLYNVSFNTAVIFSSSTVEGGMASSMAGVQYPIVIVGDSAQADLYMLQCDNNTGAGSCSNNAVNVLDEVNLTDNTHYITSGLSTGLFNHYTTTSGTVMGYNLANGCNYLGQAGDPISDRKDYVYCYKDAEMYNGSLFPEKRISLGFRSQLSSYWTDEAKEIYIKSIVWASNETVENVVYQPSIGTVTNITTNETINLIFDITGDHVYTEWYLDGALWANNTFNNNTYTSLTADTEYNVSFYARYNNTLFDYWEGLITTNNNDPTPIWISHDVFTNYTGNQSVYISYTYDGTLTYTEWYKDAVLQDNNTNTDYNFTSLDAETSYTFSVKSCYNSTLCNTTNLIIVTQASPVAYLSISSFTCVVANEQIDLSWSTSGYYDYSELRRDTSLVYNSTTKSYSDTGLSNATSYTYNLTVYYNEILNSTTKVCTTTNTEPSATPQQCNDNILPITTITNFIGTLVVVFIMAIVLGLIALPNLQIREQVTIDKLYTFIYGLVVVTIIMGVGILILSRIC